MASAAVTNYAGNDFHPEVRGVLDGVAAPAAFSFASNRHGALNLEIYVMNANGSGQTRLTTNTAADVSPDW
jgi:hypothetical protein